MSEHTTSLPSPIILRFPHTKDDLRRLHVRDDFGDYELYRISPNAAHWPAELVPDKVNPRSHDENCLQGKVAEAIEKTLREDPDDFWLANRGGFLLADRVKFDPQRSFLEITLTDLDLHGMADGATTNAVIAKVRSEQEKSNNPDLLAALTKARFNLDVVTGLTDHDRIAKLVQGRNRSVQVKEWSLNDFRGEFDWLKVLIDRNGGPFAGRIGWEENSPADVSVLDLISILTLFHPMYSGRNGRRRSAPTSAFSSKGSADKRFTDDAMASGYRLLEPVIEDILRLYDYVYARFEPAYERYNREVHNKGAKLGKRRGTRRLDTDLPFTGEKSEYRVDKGLLFPLLAAHRCLLDYQNGAARWRPDGNPFAFFDEYGPDLVGRLYAEFEKLGSNPASVGKNSSVYEGLYEKAENLYVNGLMLARAAAE